MTNMKTGKNLALAAILILCALVQGCAKPNEGIIPRVGELYLRPRRDGAYVVYKVLAVDSHAVHIRTYNALNAKPGSDLKTTNLDVVSGHAPIDLKGWLKEKNERIGREPILDDELEGYNLYLSQH